MSPSVPPDPARPLPPDPDAHRPRSLAQRLGLLMILVVLPVTVIVLPPLLVTRIFGQRPRPKDSPPPPPAADTSGLRQELDRRANGLLPTPAPLSPDPVRVSVRDSSHVGPRAEKVKAQATRLGGSAVEGVDAGNAKHLFVDLPAGAADAFRRAVAANTPVETLATPPAAPVAGAARDQVEVFIRAAADDE